MRFTKAALMAAMLAVMAGSVQAAVLSTSVVVTIEATFNRPSCNIKVPSSYNLGTLTPGTKEHQSLDITWTCEDDALVKTALTADVVTGSKDAGNEKVYLVTSDNNITGAALSLKEEGKSVIKLTGSSGKDYFCNDTNDAAGTMMRTCKLTPVTEVSSSGPFGFASATLKFEVGYP